MTQATPAPKLFTVYVWTVNEGKRRLHLHHVAAMSGAHAEARIKEYHRDHLTADSFITTDAHLERYGDSGCSLYTTEYTNEPHVTDADFAAWVRRMLAPSWCDGERLPAPLRRLSAV